MAAKLVRRLLVAGFGLLVGLFVVEGALQLAALARGSLLPVHERIEPGERPLRILALGDSNTWGGGGAAAYPARLQSLLEEDEEEGGRRFQVINLGVPGTNSGQMLHQLPKILQAYGPDLVLLLIGANDYWNATDMDLPGAASGLRRLHRALLASRTYRLVFLTLVGLEPSPDVSGDVRRSRTALRRDAGGNEDFTVRHLEDGGLTLTYRNGRRDALLSQAEHAESVEQHTYRLMQQIERFGVPLLVLEYASEEEHYGVANRGLRRGAGRYAVSDAFRRRMRAASKGRSSEELFWPDWHPKPPMYDAFAHAVLRELRERDLLPTTAPPAGSSRPGSGSGVLPDRVDVAPVRDRSAPRPDERV